MANVVGRIPVGADTRPLEKDISTALGKNYQFKGLNEKAFTQPLGRITGSVDEFRKSLDASNARVLAFGASAGAIFAVERGFQALIGTTLKVQKNLTDINSILGLSGKNLQLFGDQLFKIASQTGQTFDTVSQAAVEFSRQGLGVEETLKRTKDALILTRLSGLDVVSSTEALTATINSFNKVALDSVTIVNKLATVDAAFAVSSADLAEAIQRVGSSAESVNINFDQLLALVTSVQQTTARGGAVIGNSLKTIFTRLERTEVLDQLEQLGLQVRNLDGSFRPAIDTLSQLAQRFDELSDAQKANVAELVGGVFQINILKAALGDLGKQYSIYNSALNTSLGASDAAIQRNEKLNETLSALVNRTLANFTKLGAEVGGLTLAPAIENLLSNVNSALESFSLSDAKGPGEKLAKGFLEGLGNYISGPGLALIGAVIGKLFINLAKFSTQAVGQILQINKGSQQQAEIQQRINALLSQNPNLIQGILSKQISLLDVENQILSTIRAQTVAREQSAKIALTMAGNLAARGVTSRGGQISARSFGFIPNFTSSEQVEIFGAYLGGYKPGKVSSMSIPGEGKVVYNQAEDVKKFPGFDQPAIMPPVSSQAGKRYKEAFEKKLGFNPYASSGFIPNFQYNAAAIREAYESGTLKKISEKAYEYGVDAKGKKLIVYEAQIKDILSSTPKGLAPDRIKDVAKLATILIPEFGGSTIIPGPVSPKGKSSEFAITNIPVHRMDPTRLKGDIQDDKAQLARNIKENILTDTSSFINTLKPLGKSVDRADLASAFSSSGEKGAYGAVNAAIGSAFEIGIKTALNYTAGESTIKDAGDFDVRGGKNLSNLQKLFGFTTGLADFKATISEGNLKSFAKKIYRELGAEARFKKQAAKAMRAFSGFIPNYSPLIESMGREISAGVSPDNIRIGQDRRLQNSANPLGLGVYNTKDEPLGLSQGIARYGDLKSARTAGASKGFVPNYVVSRREQLLAQLNQYRSNRNTGTGFSSNAILAGSIGIPIVGGVAEQFLSEENLSGRAFTRGAANLASFTATGAALGGPVGGGVGFLVGLVTTLNDIDKAANQEGIDKFKKRLEASQEQLNKLNDAFSQFNSITDKLRGAANLSANDIEKLQKRLGSVLADVPENIRKDLIKAYGEGDQLKVQSIQTDVLEAKQSEQRRLEYQTAYSEAYAPETFGEAVSSMFGFGGAEERRNKAIQKSLRLSPSTATAADIEGKATDLGNLLSDEFEKFLIIEQRAGESLDEYSKRYEKLVEEALEQPKTLVYISELAAKKLRDEAANQFGFDSPEYAAASQQALQIVEDSQKQADVIRKAIKARKDSLLASAAGGKAGIEAENFKNTILNYLNNITKSTTDLTISYSRAETEIDINSRKLQSQKNTLLENARLFLGEFSQINIEAQFEEANANLEYQKNALAAQRKLLEKVGPGLFADTLSNLSGSADLNSRNFAQFIESRSRSLTNIPLDELPTKIRELISNIENQYSNQVGISSELKNSAKSLITILNNVLVRDIPEAKADTDRLRQLFQAENEIRKQELAARLENLKNRQIIGFGGGIESLRRNDFNERVTEFTRNRYLLGSQNTLTQGRGALGILEELKKFGIGPQSVNKDLKDAIVSAQTSNIQRFSQAYGLNISQDKAREIANKQFDALNSTEMTVENIYKALQSGIKLDNQTITAINPEARIPNGNGGFSPAGGRLGGNLPLSPEAEAYFYNEVAGPIEAEKRIKAQEAAMEKIKERSVDAGNVQVKSSQTVSKLLDKIIEQTKERYTGEESLASLITQSAEAYSRLRDDTININDGLRISETYLSGIKTIGEEVEKGTLSQEEARRRINLLLNESIEQQERSNELEKIRVDQMKDLKDLADGYLTSTEYANRELERQQALARRPGYDSMQGIAVNFTNQMAYNGSQFFQDLNNSAVDVARNIQDAFSNAFQSFTSGTQTAGDAFKSFAIQILQQIQQISTQIATKLFFGALFNPLQGALSGGGGGFGGLFGFAKGGFVKGYASGGYVSEGSGMMDDVPAMLSKGEYVLNRRAVKSIQQAYGTGFLESLNAGATKGMEDGGGFSRSFDNKYLVSGWENTQGLNTKDMAGGIAALERYLGQLKGEEVISPELSNFALADTTQRQNTERMQTEQDFYEYVAYLQDNLMSNKMSYVQAQAAYTQQLEAYNRQKQQSLIGGLISAAMTIGGGLLLGGGGLGGLFGGGGGGLSGLFGGGPNASAFAMPGGMGGTYSALGSNYNLVTGGAGITSAAAMRAANTGGLGSMFGGSNMGTMALLGAGAIGAPLAINFLQGNQNQRNTVSPTRSSSGLQVSNRFRFAEGGMSPDDVPALLMQGEYVVSKDAVKKYGARFFDKLNRGQVSKFAKGGQVGQQPNLNMGAMPLEDPNINLIEAINNLAYIITESSSPANQNRSMDNIPNIVQRDTPTETPQIEATQRSNNYIDIFRNNNNQQERPYNPVVENRTSVNQSQVDQTFLVSLISSLNNLTENLGQVSASEGITNNINISVNVEGDNKTTEQGNDQSSGNGEDDTTDSSSAKDSSQKYKALTDLIKQNVIKTIIEQKRPGGLLNKNSPS